MPKKKANHKRAKRRSAAKRHPTTTAIVPVATPAPIIVQGSRVRELKREEIELLKRTVARGTSDDEFALFLWVARKHKLDPLTRQLRCIMRDVTKHHQDAKGVWVGGQQMAVQMGIDGYRSLAGRDHKDFGGCDEPEFEFGELKTAAGKTIPTKATIRLWKKGLEHPVVGVAYWDEYAPADLTAGKAFMWAKMPKHMLAKCAEALAIRKGYPELADIYTDEEMHQSDQDFTPGGRRIVDADGFSPSGTAITHQAQGKAIIDAEVERQKAEHAPTKPVATGSEALAWKQDQEKRANEASRPGNALEKKTELTNAGMVELDWTIEASPIVRGDIGNLIELLKEHCTMTRTNDWWHCLPRDAETIRRICRELNFQLVEVMPKLVPQGKPAVKGTAVGESKAGQSTAAGARPKASTEPTVVKGTIQKITVGMTGKNSPTRQVKINNAWHSCYRNTLFEHLDTIGGKEVELLVDARHQVVGIKRIGKVEFDADGVTPIIQRDREAGGRTLFGT